jgi:hypothetical protein
LSPCPSISLDPDQPLDDIVNCIKLCEPALGDHAMRGTIGLFNRQLAPDEKEPWGTAFRVGGDGSGSVW